MATTVRSSGSSYMPYRLEKIKDVGADSSIANSLFNADYFNNCCIELDGFIYIGYANAVYKMPIDGDDRAVTSVYGNIPNSAGNSFSGMAHVVIHKYNGALYAFCTAAVRKNGETTKPLIKIIKLNVEDGTCTLINEYVNSYPSYGNYGGFTTVSKKLISGRYAFYIFNYFTNSTYTNGSANFKYAYDYATNTIKKMPDGGTYSQPIMIPIDKTVLVNENVVSDGEICFLGKSGAWRYFNKYNFNSNSFTEVLAAETFSYGSINNIIKTEYTSSVYKINYDISISSILMLLGTYCAICGEAYNIYNTSSNKLTIILPANMNNGISTSYTFEDMRLFIGEQASTICLYEDNKRVLYLFVGVEYISSTSTKKSIIFVEKDKEKQSFNVINEIPIYGIFDKVGFLKSDVLYYDSDGSPVVLFSRIPDTPFIDSNNRAYPNTALYKITQ